jgi:hypothetical protein
MHSEFLAGKHLGKCPLVRPRTRWEDNIKMALKDLDCEDGNRMELTQDCIQWWAVLLAVLNL